MTRYTCCDDLRRNAVAAHTTLNGIDYLEVLDRDAPAGSPRQRTLLIRCLKPVPPLTPENVRLDGGERVRNVRIEWIARADAPPAALTTPAEQIFFGTLAAADHVLIVRTDSHGDHSPYRIRLQRSLTDERPPAVFDPRLAEVTFSFKVECESDFDCAPQETCAEPVPAPPQIDYLAKDYASFRRLLLDRLTQLMPGWGARTPADLGVTLAELLAYAGDQLSYWQDAVATEAYLETARLRASLRRHALLVDYALDEGSNARAWVQLRLADGLPEATIALADMQFLSRVPETPDRVPADTTAREYRQAMAAHPVVFEPMHPAGEQRVDESTQITLYAAHHEIALYTWGDRRCCLPVGATAATLAGHLEALRVGQVLIFEEVTGPLTGLEDDADPSHRHAVRLTAVHHSDLDPPHDALVDPLTGTLITEIEWAAEDALPFPLCVSSRTDDEHGGDFIEGVSVARGNIVLADHGATVSEPLAPMPDVRNFYPAPADRDRCGDLRREPIPVRYRPELSQRPLTHAATVLKTIVDSVSQRRSRARVAFDPDAAAARVFQWRTPDVLPVIRVTGTVLSGGTPVDQPWEPRRDLLNSEDADSHFVVEVEHDGTASLRFGDDVHGRRPEPRTSFAAAYRIGLGDHGNVGADALAHVVTDDVRIAAVRNPLAARGGTAPESAEQIQRRAPQAFRRQERAVTPEDYSEVTARVSGVQRAAATLRWTGSWHTVFVTVDRAGGVPIDVPFVEHASASVEPYRMAGHDLAFRDPIHVPLEIDITVCVEPDHFRSDVRAGILDVLGRRDLVDGRRGLFHPDGLTFGQFIYLSPIYAALRSVPGVETAEITRFRRQGQPDHARALHAGVMTLDSLEIARLDNDRNFPERGVLRLALHGGK